MRIVCSAELVAPDISQQLTLGHLLEIRSAHAFGPDKADVRQRDRFDHLVPPRLLAMVGGGSGRSSGGGGSCGDA